MASDALHSAYHINCNGTYILSTDCSSNLWHLRGLVSIIYPSDTANEKVGCSFTVGDREGNRGPTVIINRRSSGHAVFSNSFFACYNNEICNISCRITCTTNRPILEVPFLLSCHQEVQLVKVSASLHLIIPHYTSLYQ